MAKLDHVPIKFADHRVKVSSLLRLSHFRRVREGLGEALCFTKAIRNTIRAKFAPILHLRY